MPAYSISDLKRQVIGQNELGLSLVSPKQRVVLQLTDIPLLLPHFEQRAVADRSHYRAEEQKYAHAEHSVHI